MDLLGITSEDLIERFEDLIEENYEQIKTTIHFGEESTENEYRSIQYED